MNDPKDIVPGTIAGANLMRHPSPFGSMTGVTNLIVRLADGREVTATLALPPLKKSFMGRTIRIGSAVKVDLGSVLEPIRIVELEDDSN